MTYNDVLDDLFDIISRHKMIQTVGYGPLSDIKVPKDGAETNYPYAFLRPTNHTIGKNQMTYRFDLIMMEMCNDTDEEIIRAQSNCHQYIKDILAHLYYNYYKYDFNLNNSITVFQEKYDDVVSGATIQMEFIVRDQLNDCIAPFEELVTTLVGTPGLRDYNSAAQGDRSVAKWQIPEALAVYRVKGSVTFSLNRTLTDDAAPYNVPYISILQDADSPRFLADIEFDGTKVGEAQTVNIDYTFTLQDLPPDNNDLSISFGYTTGNGVYPDNTTPIQEYDGAINLISANIEIFK